MRNKNAGRIGGEAELSPSGTARPVSETRRFKSGGEEGQDVGGREGERRGKKASLPKICGPTGNTRTLLVTSRWMLRAYTGPARASPVYIV